MPLDFPTSPVDGQQYTFSGKTWVYDAPRNAWLPVYSGSGTASFPQIVKTDNPTRVRTAERWRVFEALELEEGAEILMEDGSELQIL